MKEGTGKKKSQLIKGRKRIEQRKDRKNRRKKGMKETRRRRMGMELGKKTSRLTCHVQRKEGRTDQNKGLRFVVFFKCTLAMCSSSICFENLAKKENDKTTEGRILG